MPYDFQKMKNENSNYQLPTHKTDFMQTYNTNTGEIDGKLIGKYFDMNIIKYESGRNLIKGSLHKFYNRIDFNGDDFTITMVEKAIEQLQNELNLNPAKCRLENIEFGVNVQLPFNPDLILKNLLFHNSKKFNQTIPNSYFSISEKNQYSIKIYNKTAQYKNLIKNLEYRIKNAFDEIERKKLEFEKNKILENLKPNTLRFEIKFTKMKIPNELGLFYLSDLTKPNVLENFKNLLLKELRDVYFHDYTINENLLSKVQKINIKDFKNPNFWQNLNRKDKYYYKREYEKIIENFSQNIKEKLIESVSEKLNILLEKV